jgi:hypothetical protein
VQAYDFAGSNGSNAADKLAWLQYINPATWNTRNLTPEQQQKAGE